jgi:hypothetical protein
MRWIFFFNLPNPFSRTMALGSTQSLTEISTRNLPGGKNRPARRADNLAAICEPNVWKCGSLNNTKGLHGLYRDNFTFFYTDLKHEILKITKLRRLAIPLSLREIQNNNHNRHGPWGEVNPHKGHIRREKARNIWRTANSDWELSTKLIPVLQHFHPFWVLVCLVLKTGFV